jgi:UDP-N-acetyl-D-glucosamine dehydrogenase
MHQIEGLDREGRGLRGARVLVLGAAYKRDTADLRESPALALLSRLDRAGAAVSYHDPHVPRIGSGCHYRLDLRPGPLTAEALAAADAMAIVTDHGTVDTRNVTQAVAKGREKIIKA